MATRLEQMMEGKLDARGNEIPDPTPLALPAGFKEPESLQDQIRRLIRTSLSDAAQNEGMETFEEAEDFEIEDDMFDPSSPYEEVFDPVLGRGITLQEWKDNEEVYRQRHIEAEERAWQVLDTSNALRARPKPAEQSGREATPRELPAAKVDKSGS